MRKLSEIIDICKDGGKPTIEEARFAICAMDSLMIFDSLFHTRRAAKEMRGKKPDFFSAVRDYEYRFSRMKGAMAKTPLEWLGDSNNPDRQEVQKRKKISNKNFNKVIDGPR